jgi:hypothetical protein
MVLLADLGLGMADIWIPLRLSMRKNWNSGDSCRNKGALDMTSILQRSVLLELAIQLKRNGSWTGETHVQKAAFLLRELLDIPVGFDFVLYKHGPFSFDLREMLNEMEAERLIRLEEQAYPCGPKIVEESAAPAFRDPYGEEALAAGFTLADASAAECTGPQGW